MSATGLGEWRATLVMVNSSSGGGAARALRVCPGAEGLPFGGGPGRAAGSVRPAVLRPSDWVRRPGGLRGESPCHHGSAVFAHRRYRQPVLLRAVAVVVPVVTRGRDAGDGALGAGAPRDRSEAGGRGRARAGCHTRGCAATSTWWSRAEGPERRPPRPGRPELATSAPMRQVAPAGRTARTSQRWCRSSSRQSPIGTTRFSSGAWPSGHRHQRVHQGRAGLHRHVPGLDVDVGEQLVRSVVVTVAKATMRPSLRHGDLTGRADGGRARTAARPGPGTHGVMLRGPPAAGSDHGPVPRDSSRRRCQDQ